MLRAGTEPGGPWDLAPESQAQKSGKYREFLEEDGSTAACCLPFVRLQLVLKSRGHV